MFNAAQIAYMDSMIDFYNETAYTHEYIFGFTYGDELRAIVLNWKDFRRALKYDKAATSKGGMLKIRVKPDSMTIKAWLRKSFKIGTVADLTADKKYNKGENFERVVTEKLCDEKWEKDSIPYTEAGDVIWNGTPYQVKFNGAELTNAKTFENLRMVKG